MEEAAEASEAAAPILTHLTSSIYNTTSALIPSPKDLFMLVPRMASRVPTLFSSDLPLAFENFFGGPLTGRVIASATGAGREGSSLAAAAAAAGQTVAGAATVVGDIIGDDGAVGGIGEATGANTGGFIQGFDLKQLRTFGGVFTYVTSKWALGCFTAAIVLNRTSIYASARRNLRLDWQWRLMVRLVPILMLLSLSRELTRALRCQSSPAFSEMRYGVPGKHTGLDYSGEGGLLYSLSSMVLVGETDEQSCAAAGMIPREDKPKDFPRGSLALLWPSFQAFCTAQWVETLLCALQGRQPATETGMSLFEHSLAFAEAEAMVSNQIGLSPWGSGDRKNGSSQKVVGEAGAETTEATVLVTKSFIVSRFNTPPEVLLMALISTLNNLSSQILGVFDMQAKYRLLNTGVWGMGFMASFIWGFLTFSVDQGVNSGIFRFPTVCVVGFIPHTLILLGIGLCACIYSIALGISVLSPPEGYPRNMSWRQRFWVAHENMQANIPLSGLRINWREDFYTALLRVGFTALTAASEAVFLNEGRRINVGHWTWLEEERLEEIAKLRATASLPDGMDGVHDSVANGVILSADDDTKLLGDGKWQSGYAREKNTKALKGRLTSPQGNTGVGADQRGSRYRSAFIFLSRIFWLLTGWMASVAGKALARIGIRNYPWWLHGLFASTDTSKGQAISHDATNPLELPMWMLTDDGERVSPTNREVDVEAEFRKRERLGYRRWGATQETKLDNRLYEWFLEGGWWGETDSSGNYEEPTAYGGLDDDLTSVISTTETEEEFQEWSDSSEEDEGQRTPTQRNLFTSSFTSPPTTRSFSRASTPFSTISNHSATHSATHAPIGEDTPLDPSDLARLLGGQDPEARHEARMLAAHLSSTRILTRSQYREATVSNGAHVLTSTRQRPPGFRTKTTSGKLTAQEEAEVLEWLIISRRERKNGARQQNDVKEAKAEGKAQSWEEGGDGLGSGGPMCVVCQSSARTILAWPCRCLSLCEECRVSLAMNNFATCVCCRQEVVGFSRLFVP